MTQTQRHSYIVFAGFESSACPGEVQHVAMCSAVSPGKCMRAVDLNKMHLLNEVTGAVI